MPSDKVRKERYCGMCDKWFPVRVGKECPKCGFDLSQPVVNLMDALIDALPQPKVDQPADHQEQARAVPAPISGMCRDGSPHYCPNCDRSFAAPAEQARASQEQHGAEWRLVRAGDVAPLDGGHGSWVETTHPAVIACMGSAPPCIEGGCQLNRQHAELEQARAEIALPVETTDVADAIIEVRELREQLTEARAEIERLDLKWAAVSEFIRDVIEALGSAQPPETAIVDLSELALQVVGQIEEYKTRAERAAQKTSSSHDH